jgi:phosphoheptose isomerase
MKFPIKRYLKTEQYKNDYYENFKTSFENIDFVKVDEVIKILDIVYKDKKRKVMICGNGGSAALANHFACDHQKLLSGVGNLRPFVVSLSANSALMTAISNDNNYDYIFSDQIKQIGDKSDILITISSSGNSKNIVNAIKVAKKMSILTISLTGFNGGISRKLADKNIHVNCINYGIVESLHHTIMNIMSQFIKNKYLSKKKIQEINF